MAFRQVLVRPSEVQTYEEFLSIGAWPSTKSPESCSHPLAQCCARNVAAKLMPTASHLHKLHALAVDVSGHCRFVLACNLALHHCVVLPLTQLLHLLWLQAMHAQCYSQSHSQGGAMPTMVGGTLSVLCKLLPWQHPQRRASSRCPAHG